jgi:hypothetical protein
MTPPDDEQDEYTPRPLLGRAFWAALTLGLILTLAGGAVGLFGARWFPVDHPRPAPHGRSEEVKVAPKPAEGEEFEEPDDTPEIDEVVEADADVVDDDDTAEPAAEPDIGVDFEEEPADLEEADSEDVPFLEEEDEDFVEDEIEPHRDDEH